jgi:hypothetical protein
LAYFEDIFYTIVIFVIAYLIFKNDLFNLLANSGIIEKDFSSCYILKYPKHAELHNKNLVYRIDIEEFFKLNPKLKGKIKVIERPEVDTTKVGAVKAEVEERQKIKDEFYGSKKKLNNKIA